MNTFNALNTTVSRAMKIAHNGIISAFEVTEPTLKCYQNAVGGYIEIVRPRGLPRPYVMLVDDEGWIKEKPLNIIASLIYGYNEHKQPIAGDVLIIKDGVDKDGEHDILPLDANEYKKLIDIIKSLEFGSKPDKPGK